MRIADIHTRANEPVSPAPKVGGAAATEEASAAAPSAAVTVTLSAEALSLSAKASDGADEAKVSRLQSAIQAGTFTIDPQKIASRIVGD